MAGPAHPSRPRSRMGASMIPWTDQQMAAILSVVVLVVSLARFWRPRSRSLVDEQRAQLAELARTRLEAVNTAAKAAASLVELSGASDPHAAGREQIPVCPCCHKRLVDGRCVTVFCPIEGNLVPIPELYAGPRLTSDYLRRLRDRAWQLGGEVDVVEELGVGPVDVVITAVGADAYRIGP